MKTQKLALVTGSAKRLGKAVIESFAKAGYDCLVHANTSVDEARSLCQQLEACGVRAKMALVPIEDPHQAAEALLNSSIEIFGKLPDASVLCAASYDNDFPSEVDPVKMARQLALNFEFPAAYCARLGKHLEKRIERVDCSVTLFTDYKVSRVNPDFFSYSLSKHALDGVLPYLTVAFAPLFRVNAIAPGPVLCAHGMTQEQLDAMVDSESVSGRHPKSGDVASAALFLAQNESLYGQHIFVDAGARFDKKVREVSLGLS